jgi:predicted DNA-binding ribbon-helix-helix protein
LKRLLNFLELYKRLPCKMTAQPQFLSNDKIRKRSVMLAGHATSLSLEEAFWDALKLIAKTRNLSINGLIGQIDHDRCTKIDGSSSNLSSAVRVFVLHNRTS